MKRERLERLSWRWREGLMTPPKGENETLLFLEGLRKCYTSVLTGVNSPAKTAGKKPGKESPSWAAAWRRGGKGNQRASKEMTSWGTASHSLPFGCCDFFFFFLTRCTVIPIIWNLLKCVSYFVVLLQQGMLFPDGNASEEAVRCGAATVLLRKFNPSVSDKVTSPWEHFWQMGGHAQPPVATLYFSPPTGLQWAVPSERPPFAAHHSFLLLSTPMATVHTEMSHVFHLGTSVFSFTPNSII